jgi:hypothetical protein
MQIEPAHARQLSRALTRPTFASLARGSRPEDVFRFLRGPIKVHHRKPITVGQLLEWSYEAVHRSYRNEYIYKTALASRIVFGRHSPKTSSMQVELPVGRSIVDVAIFNGTSTAYEIKTELDSPRRLITQTKDYLTAFEQVYVVTAPVLAGEYTKLCDPRVGILALERNDSLRVVRRATSNLEAVDPHVLFRMLRRDEYVSALEKLIGERIDLPNGLVSSHCEALFTSLNKGAAHTLFLGAMRQRTTQAEQVGFLRALPAHLRVLGYATPLSRPQREKLLSTLDSLISFR